MNTCLRCGYEWKPRVKEGKVRRCPHCTSPAWDRELKVRGRKKGTKVAKKRATGQNVMVIEMPVQADQIDQAREILRRINA